MIPMIGVRSGRLLVIAQAQSIKKRAMWLCRCDCGKEVVRMGKYLRAGEIKSCGCLNRAPITGVTLKHGHARHGFTRTYSTWASMVQRCTNPNSTSWFKYGGKKIAVCKRWLAFKNFLADMGKRPEGMTIDRINPKGNYTRANCRWATAAQQAGNQTKTRYISFGGKRQHLTAWAKELGITPATLHRRLEVWPVKVALTSKRGWDFRRK